MKLDTDQVVTQTQIAAMKGMKLPLLAYHLAKPDAPKPVDCLGKKAYRLIDVIEWNPKRSNRGRKPK